ncbi:MAG: hypothetical protein MR218_10470 [Eubacterium sp.]|nr:hypothetical protein [Eubacterium sp.]
MKVAIVTHSSTFEDRAEAVAQFFEEKGHTAVRVFSDFDHHGKRTVQREAENHVYIHLRPYTRNLSLTRLMAIRRFALDAGAYLESGGFDLIYFMIPANSFAAEAERIRRKTGVHVIFDLIDLWPESLPLRAAAHLTPILRWRNLRDHHLGCADVIFTECGFYREQLDLPENRTYTLYWCKLSGDNKYRASGERIRTDPGGAPNPEKTAVHDNAVYDNAARDNVARDNIAHDNVAHDNIAHDAVVDDAVVRKSSCPEQSLRIAYIGAINNIIDIPRIAYLLGALNRRRKVIADIIGEGEHRDDFIRELRNNGVETVCRGAVYEEDRKAEILSRCCLGINVMRTDVHVGLSMKSIDYLSYGVPLINSIKGDLWEFASTCGIGVNIPDNLMTMTEEDLNLILDRLIAVAEDPQARRKCVDLYRKNFTQDAFNRTLERALEEQKLLPRSSIIA